MIFSGDQGKNYNHTHPGIEKALRSLMRSESILALEELHECQTSCHSNPFHHFLRAKAYQDLGFKSHAQKYYQNIVKISQQEKKLKQAQFCNKIITEAQKCLNGLREKSTSIEGEAALQLMQEESHTPRRLSLAHNYSSKTKKMDTVDKEKQGSLQEALQKQVIATLPTEETLVLKNSHIHKRSSSDDIRLYMLKYASPQKKKKDQRNQKQGQNVKNVGNQDYELMRKSYEEQKEEEVTEPLHNSRTWINTKGVGADLTEPQSAVFGLILEEDYDL